MWNAKHLPVAIGMPFFTVSLKLSHCLWLDFESPLMEGFWYWPWPTCSNTSSMLPTRDVYPASSTISYWPKFTWICFLGLFSLASYLIWRHQTLNCIGARHKHIFSRCEILRSLTDPTIFSISVYEIKESKLDFGMLKNAVTLPFFPNIMGIETITIPVPDQTYFMRNCSSMMYQSLCEKSRDICSHSAL